MRMLFLVILASAALAGLGGLHVHTRQQARMVAALEAAELRAEKERAAREWRERWELDMQRRDADLERELHEIKRRADMRREAAEEAVREAEHRREMLRIRGY